MSFAGILSRIGEHVAATLNKAADEIARALDGAVEGAGETCRVVLPPAARAREFGTATRAAKPRLSEALADVDLAGNLTAALKEAIADDT